MEKNTLIQRIKNPLYRGFLLGFLVLFVMAPFHPRAEVIGSAISSDDVTFTMEPGFCTSGIYADPYILVAEQGNWVDM